MRHALFILEDLRDETREEWDENFKIMKDPIFMVSEVLVSTDE